MKTYPYTIENGAGEQVTFVGIVQDSDGPRVVGEGCAQPKSGPPMHVHYFEEEGFTVKVGKIGYQLVGEAPRYAGAGETVRFPAGTGHRWWNAGTTELRFTGWAKPPNNHEYILATIFTSMKRNGGRRPSLFDIAFLGTRYRAEWGMLAVPTVVQRILFPVVVRMGQALGRYEHFKDAPEPLDRRTVQKPQSEAPTARVRAG